MLVVKIELHSAITGEISEIGKMIIANTGGTRECGDYRVAVSHKNDLNDLKKIWTEPCREGEVKSYPRLSYNVWRLVSRAIRSAFPEEK